MKYHRNKLGQFSINPYAKPMPKNRLTTRQAAGHRYAKHQREKLIRNGSLYDLNGVVVRVRQTLSNGMKLVSVHNSLFGFAKISDLKKIGSHEVENYLYQ